MAGRWDLEDAELRAPWQRADFRAGLALLSEDASAASRRYAAQAAVLAELAGMVPRCAFDERGATPWTSFRREVAVARRTSDRAAASLLRIAARLTTCLPVTLQTLRDGSTTVERAEAFVRALDPCTDELAARVDRDHAQQAAGLPPWRISQLVRRAVLVLDPEAGAARVATRNADRGVTLLADDNDQASVLLFGPAVPLTRWYGSLDDRARALKQGGDPRPLDALRFDLAAASLPCAVHEPADPTARHPFDAAVDPHRPGAAPHRPGFVEAASSDCRMSRPVQASIVVPVETALGLSHEPSWLDGYGWISAPTTRQLLVDAELRRVCAHTSTGELVDVADRVLRPPSDPAGLRGALLDMVLDTPTLTGAADRVEPEHDPSEPLRRFVVVRDRTCDGPTGSQTPARSCHLDHDHPHPAGPTAAWNLVARSARTHQLKHYGWTPLRTPAGTLWTSPAGQIVLVPRHTAPPPGIDSDTDLDGGQPAMLPHPDDLDLLDRAQLEPPDVDDRPPWLPESERDHTTWTWLHDDDDLAC